MSSTPFNQRNSELETGTVKITASEMAKLAHVQYISISPRLSGHFSIFGWFSLCRSLVWELRDIGKFAILTLKPRGHDRILRYRTWADVRQTQTADWQVNEVMLQHIPYP